MGNLPAFLSDVENLITVFKAFCYNTAADEQKERKQKADIRGCQDERIGIGI